MDLHNATLRVAAGADEAIFELDAGGCNRREGAHRSRLCPLLPGRANDDISRLEYKAQARVPSPIGDARERSLGGRYGDVVESDQRRLKVVDVLSELLPEQIALHRQRRRDVLGIREVALTGAQSHLAVVEKADAEIAAARNDAAGL